MNGLRIEAMTLNQSLMVAAVHRNAFPSDGDTTEDSVRWIEAKFRGWPASRYYLALEHRQVVGYILWSEMGGFRNKCVLSLEQIGVRLDKRGEGIGLKLIDESLYFIAVDLANLGRSLKLVEVSTGKGNHVQRLYEKSLGATIKATLGDLFDDDEVIMVARAEDIASARVSRSIDPLPLR